MRIFTIGHNPPDLDSVAGAVEYAEFLRLLGRYGESEIKPAMAADPNEETRFVFKKLDVKLPEKITADDLNPEDRIILVDHNEEDQRMPGIDPEKIIEIIDHHKIKMDFATSLRVDIRPLGSVSSVIYENYVKERLTPSKKVASLILASIISDTQGLKSSLTTGWDTKAAEDLSKLTGLDIEKLTFEIFKAKSDIEGLSPAEIVKKDFKIYDFAGKKVFIGQVETVEPKKVLSMKAALIKVMEEVKAEEKVGLLFLAVTDILKINSRLLYSTEEERRIAEAAFNGVGENGEINIGPRMSRKKDITPEIERVLSK